MHILSKINHLDLTYKIAKMYRSFLPISVCVSPNSCLNMLLCVARNYCSVGKGRKKRASKVDESEVLKLSDSLLPSENIISNDVDRSIGQVYVEPQNSTKTSALDNKPAEKKQRKTSSKEKTDKTAKEKKTKPSLPETEIDEPKKLTLMERYGDSLNMPGMKPFSSVKKKSDVPQAKPSGNDSDGNIKTSNISEQISPASQDSIDISEAIPKLRSPSFRLEQRLIVPAEWVDMAEWTPSVGFLKSILEYPIEGLGKSTDFSEKDADHLSCFVTENKDASKHVPAVTTVLSKTMTSAQAFALKLWRERLTKQLGEEGFQKHKIETFSRGKQFHDTIQRYLQGESVRTLNIENLPLITGCWKSLVPVLNRIDGVIAVESEVLHPQLLYRGVIDCIVEIKGQPFIVEWKHSSRKRESLQKNYDSPVQLMAYTGAINSNASYPFGVKNSLLVVAYEDGSPADVFLLSTPENGEHHWRTWLKRLHTYWTLLKADRELGD